MTNAADHYGSRIPQALKLLQKRYSLSEQLELDGQFQKSFPVSTLALGRQQSLVRPHHPLQTSLAVSFHSSFTHHSFTRFQASHSMISGSPCTVPGSENSGSCLVVCASFLNLSATLDASRGQVNK